MYLPQIRLTRSELHLAEEIARERQARRQSRGQHSGYKAGYNATAEQGLANNVKGVRGEMAFSKWSGLPLDRGHISGKPDFVTRLGYEIDTKCTNFQTLCLRENELQKHRNWIGWQVQQVREDLYTICGWRFLREVKRVSRLDDFGYSNRTPMHVVELSDCYKPDLYSYIF